MESNPIRTTPSVAVKRTKRLVKNNTSKGELTTIFEGSFASGSEKPQAAPRMNSNSNGNSTHILKEKIFFLNSNHERFQILFSSTIVIKYYPPVFSNQFLLHL